MNHWYEYEKQCCRNIRGGKFMGGKIIVRNALVCIKESLVRIADITVGKEEKNTCNIRNTVSRKKL